MENDFVGPTVAVGIVATVGATLAGTGGAGSGVGDTCVGAGVARIAGCVSIAGALEEQLVTRIAAIVTPRPCTLSSYHEGARGLLRATTYGVFAQYVGRHDEHDHDASRREALVTLAMGSGAVLVGCSPPRTPPTSPPLGEPTMTTPTALAGNHAPLPLPFDPGALPGLSEKLLRSHHENNYGGAVKNLNRVEQELARIDADTPPFVVAALRDRELTFRNSKALHEAYFANLGGDGRRSGAIESALADAYGSSARWEQHMRATGMGLGGGSGWALVVLELDTGALRTVASGHHTQVSATSVPLLVMDMYEHSYQMDFGAAVPRYIDAFFANVSWDEVNRRLERARRMSALFRGS